jgi:uncharacterized protein YneR
MNYQVEIKPELLDWINNKGTSISEIINSLILAEIEREYEYEIEDKTVLVDEKDMVYFNPFRRA